MNIEKSTIVKSQAKHKFVCVRGGLLKVKYRFDDQCGNGHNTFSITGEFWKISSKQWEGGDYKRLYHADGIPQKYKDGQMFYLESCGCIHEMIEKNCKSLSGLIKWHLVSTDGPMHYIANTIYWIKEGNLEYARKTAIWPEATDEQLNDDNIKQVLSDRLEGLLVEFKTEMESFGFNW